MAIIKRERGHAAATEVAPWPDEWFDHAFRDMFQDYFGAWPGVGRLFDGAQQRLMHLEEFVEDGHCVIRAEMPGLDPDKDVEASIADGVLTLRAHRSERTEDERPDGYRSEFRYGSFVRRVRLPEGATEDDITATYKDGILEVRVPVETAPVEAKATKIAIQHS